MSELRSKLVVSAFFVIVIVLVTLAVLYSHPPEVDPLTLCRLDRSDRPVAVVALDQSNRFERGDIERSKALAARIIRSLATDEKLIALEVSPLTPHEPTVLFERCAPKREAEWSSAFDDLNALKRESDVFATAFWSATKDAFERQDLPKSPILETLAYVSERGDFRSSSSRRVFLFSDLLQNFGKLDFYKTIPLASAVTDDTLNVDAVDFSATTVYFLMAARRQQWTSRPELKTFWNAWLQSRKATIGGELPVQSGPGAR